MLIRFFLVIFLFVLSGCSKTQNEKFSQHLSITDIIDKSNSLNKMSLIYLTSPQEKYFDSKILRLLKEKFNFHIINNEEQNEIKKLLHTDYSPLFILLDSDSLLHITTSLEEIIANLDKFYNKSYLSANNIDLKKISNLSASNENIKKSFKETIKIKYQLDKGLANKQLHEYAKMSVEAMPYFYNRYLLSQTYEHNDSIEIFKLYDSLWASTTKLDRKIYVNELLSIHDNRSNRSQLNKSQLTFPILNHDFGNIHKNDIAKYDYLFSNKSDKPIIITSINTTCDCTVAQWPQDPILQGEKRYIMIEFTPKDYGANYKLINIRTSEPACITLSICAMVTSTP